MKRLPLICFLLLILIAIMPDNKILAQARPHFNHLTVYVVDLKKSADFYEKVFQLEIIPEIEEKIAILKIPRGYAPIPVLFHISGVAPSVETSRIFYRIIDIADFLN